MDGAGEDEELQYTRRKKREMADIWLRLSVSNFPSPVSLLC